MGTYSCQRCGYNTKLLCDFKRHLSRKIICIDTNSCGLSQEDMRDYLDLEISKKHTKTKVKTYQCENCERSFDSKFRKYYHKKTCTKVPKDVQGIIDHIKAAVPSQVVINITNIQNQTNNTNNNINSNNTTNTQLNAFGNESIAHVLNNKERLTSNYLFAANGFINTAKDLFFNEEHPENKTVRITNKKLPYADTFDGERWQTREQRAVLKDMVNTVKNIIDEHVDEHKDEIEHRYRHHQNILQKAQKFLNDIKDSLDNEETMTPHQMRSIKNIVQQMRILVINNT